MWDYLIITASNDAQAAGYRMQLELRQKLGLLTDVDKVCVVADPGGRRIGSGGSTLYCLLHVLQDRGGSARVDLDRFYQVLGGLRILIIHAGGDSKRLPAYGPCGKIFVPVPGESDSSLPMTLFDRQLPTYLALPPSPPGRGQVVIASGDVMLRFDPAQVHFDQPGLTGLGCYADPQQAANHGVYAGVDADGRVKRFLQKPTPDQQAAMGATNHYGQSILDIGVMHFDAALAVRLLELFGVCSDGTAHLQLSGQMAQAVADWGLDFYREICCAMGSDATSAHHIQTARSSGSSWSDAHLARLLEVLDGFDFNLQLLRRCDFIDFGSTRHIIQSGTVLLQQDIGAPHLQSCLDINNDRSPDGMLIGTNAWVEGCRVTAPLTLGGFNVVSGLDIDIPLTLPAGACVDVAPALSTDPCWFVRCYHVDDTFKDTVSQNATFCGMPVLDWIEAVGADPADIWDGDSSDAKHTVWNARLFPTASDPAQYHRWLWMFTPNQASDSQRRAWLKADRFSLAQIAAQTDSRQFFNRRLDMRAAQIRTNLHEMFRWDCPLSADELTDMIARSPEPADWIAAGIAEAKWQHENGQGLSRFSFPRTIHTLASVLEGLNETVPLKQIADRLEPGHTQWLETVGLSFNSGITVQEWIRTARALAFDSLSSAILCSSSDSAALPVCTLRTDEIVWGRAPARLDTGGGWTDTPPYALEYGGCVVNAAVDLNGQPPIQAYLRCTDQQSITIGSIDLGTRIHVTQLDELLDYREPTSQYGLVKAALALSGFSSKNGTSLADLLRSFGGGLEITTLAAIPKGSGLGTSSIMGAVILAVIHRAMGIELTGQELFNKVLQLEQALTTGGGWQDQIGGVVGGVKIISTQPALVPNPRIHYLPSDALDPTVNGGTTLLYYTGITRLAKNILEQVVGRYLDRSRRAMATLRKIDALTAEVAEALSRKDRRTFGRLIQTAWQLNKQLDPNSTNDQVESLFERIGPHIEGAKLLGAGGGGFILMICKSAADADAVRTLLNQQPPNERARFFEYGINQDGLIVTVC